MGAGKNFLNWLQGTFGGNNNAPDVPLPIEDKAPKPVVKKAAPKKAAPKKKEQ